MDDQGRPGAVGADLVIESPANQRVKDLVALQTRRRVRIDRGEVVVEGHDEIALAVEGEAVVRSLHLCPVLHRRPDSGLVDRIGRTGAQVIELGEQAFRKAAYRDAPDGWLAVVAAPDRQLAELTLTADPLLLVCEGVEKPGNLGAMLRTADAAGAEACVAVAPGTDWGNPNVVRASKGTVFTVPVASTTPEAWFLWAAERGVQLVAATPAATVDHSEADLTGPLAIAVGAEHCGLSDRLLAAADVRVRIPMIGRVNSLNVAMSAGLLLYEARRQRGWPTR
jgi:TrmH family RNA methyltransferase